jgi:hypothetical protein
MSVLNNRYSPDIDELFRELDIKLTDGVGYWKGHPVRYLEEAGMFQIGDKDFDRWSNSVDLEFEIWLPKGQRKLRKWMENGQ